MKSSVSIVLVLMVGLLALVPNVNATATMDGYNWTGLQNILGLNNLTSKQIGGVIYADQYPTIQDAINAMNSTRITQQKIIISGNNLILSAIQLSNYTDVELIGNVYSNSTWTPTSGTGIFDISGKNNISIYGGGSILCNFFTTFPTASGYGTNLNGIFANNATDIFIKEIGIDNCDAGINIHGARNVVTKNVKISNVQVGVQYTGYGRTAYDNIITDIFLKNTSDLGVGVTAGTNNVSHTQITNIQSYNSKIAVELAGGSQLTNVVKDTTISNINAIMPTQWDGSTVLYITEYVSGYYSKGIYSSGYDRGIYHNTENYNNGSLSEKSIISDIILKNINRYGIFLQRTDQVQFNNIVLSGEGSYADKIAVWLNTGVNENISNISFNYIDIKDFKFPIIEESTGIQKNIKYNNIDITNYTSNTFSTSPTRRINNVLGISPYNFGNSATAPNANGAGDTYFDTALDVPRFYNSSGWQSVGTGSSGSSYNASYNALLTNAPNTTVAANLANWNATYNSSYAKGGLPFTITNGTNVIGTTDSEDSFTTAYAGTITKLIAHSSQIGSINVSFWNASNSNSYIGSVAIAAGTDANTTLNYAFSEENRIMFNVTSVTDIKKVALFVKTTKS